MVAQAPTPAGVRKQKNHLSKVVKGRLGHQGSHLARWPPELAPTNQVEVKMGHRLAPHLVDIEDQAVTAIGDLLLTCQGLSPQQHAAEAGPRPRGRRRRC